MCRQTIDALLASSVRDNTTTPKHDENALIRSLNRIYVEANQRVEAGDRSVEETARARFAQLERGDPDLEAQRSAIRDLTVRQLAATYERLNVPVDHFHGESMYKVDDALKTLGDHLVDMGDGRKGVDIGKEAVTVVKSDGSGLYITRDVAAAVHRKELFQVL